MSWRDSIKIHPAADIFPLLNDDDLGALAEDIKRNDGLVVPVAIRVNDDGQPELLDGRNRLDAMERIGWRVKFVNHRGRAWSLLVEGHHDEEYPAETLTYGPAVDVISTDPVEYITSLNIHRRNLTAETKRELISNLLKENPERSDRSEGNEPDDEDDDFDEGIAFAQTKAAFLARAAEAEVDARYFGIVDDEIVQAAQATADAWSKLATAMQPDRRKMISPTPLTDATTTADDPGTESNTTIDLRELRAEAAKAGYKIRKDRDGCYNVVGQDGVCFGASDLGDIAKYIRGEPILDEVPADTQTEVSPPVPASKSATIGETPETCALVWLKARSSNGVEYYTHEAIAAHGAYEIRIISADTGRVTHTLAFVDSDGRRLLLGKRLGLNEAKRLAQNDHDARRQAAVAPAQPSDKPAVPQVESSTAVLAPTNAHDDEPDIPASLDRRPGANGVPV
jgi:hypothetical protein